MSFLDEHCLLRICHCLFCVMSIFLSQHLRLKQIRDKANDEVFQQRNTDSGGSLGFSTMALSSLSTVFVASSVGGFQLLGLGTLRLLKYYQIPLKIIYY